MLTLSTLKGAKGSHRNTKRIGRGQGSGQGTQAGKGHKGQKARKSGHVRLGFEGGSMPIYMRLPKTGTFSNALFKKEYSIISLKQLSEKFAEGDQVTREKLVDFGYLKGINKRLPIKVLATEKFNFNKKLIFSGIDKFSKTALEQITKVGGKVQ